MKVLIISPGGAPIPAVKGGAVETLIDYIVEENELSSDTELRVSTIFDKNAYEVSKSFKNTFFIQYKVSRIAKILDKITYFIAKNILRINKLISFRFIFQKLFYIKFLRKMLLKEDFDKVVMENNTMHLLIFKKNKLLKKYDNKLYYHIHNLVPTDYGCSNVFLNCKKIITVSDYISFSFLKRYPLYDSKNIVKLPNVADLELFRHKSDNTKLKEALGIKEDDVVIMFSGRLTKEKGALELIQAFLNIKNEHTKLLIVGSYNFGHNMSSEYERELKKYTNILKDSIIFTGFIDFKEMPIYYSMSDIVVLPSIWDDPAPLTIIEALSSGKPLITTKSGGIPEYASSCAILLERDNELIKNIQLHLLELINNPNIRREISSRALEVTKSWTKNSFYNNFINILSKESLN